jgi:predicted DNA-binding transcriptional regulator AlpA
MSRSHRLRDGRDRSDGAGGTEPSAPTSESRFLPRGMSRIESAYYVGVSPSLFDEMVNDGRMPGPKRINTRVVWDRFALDAAFEAVPDKVEVVADDDWQVAL